MGKAMIIAGIGCRKGVSVDEVVAAIDAALATYGLARDALSALATTAFKRDEQAIFSAGEELGLSVMVVEHKSTALEPAVLPLTRSERSIAVAGSPSVSEEAALLAAGPGARLLGPRIVAGPVTCALAENGGRR